MLPNLSIISKNFWKILQKFEKNLCDSKCGVVQQALLQYNTYQVRRWRTYSFILTQYWRKYKKGRRWLFLPCGEAGRKKRRKVVLYSLLRLFHSIPSIDCFGDALGKGAHSSQPALLTTADRIAFSFYEGPSQIFLTQTLHFYISKIFLLQLNVKNHT